MADLFGPEFWKEQFGFADFDEFFEKAGPYLEGMHFPLFTPPTEAMAQIAWNSPQGTLGGYIYVRLRAEGFEGSERTAVTSVGDGLTGAILRAFQNGALFPMAQLIIPSCFQVAIKAQASGQQVVNVIGVRNAAGTALGAAQAVQTAWKVANGPMTQLTAAYALTEFRAMDIGSSNGAIATVTDTTAGGQASLVLSTMAASALVKWNGGTRSANSRGRLYFGPLTEPQLNSDGRTLAGATATSIATAFNNFRASLSSGGYPLVVLSRQTSTAFDVTSSSVESVIATQRRRIRD